MNLGALAFYVVAAVVIASALGVVITKSVVYSALLLVLTLLMTGLVYLLLLSDFLALVQILVYGGTVSILLLFALMLTRPQEGRILNHKGWPLAALSSLVLLVMIGIGVIATDWNQSFAQSARMRAGAALGGLTPATSAAAVVSERIGPEQLGTALFTVWAVPFEIASVVLLVALLGALLIARSASAEG